jgi:YD repeat-containing protein
MPNRRTLRRLARTGHPVLVAVAGHRARALPPAPPPRPTAAPALDPGPGSAGHRAPLIAAVYRPATGRDHGTGRDPLIQFTSYSDAAGGRVTTTCYDADGRITRISDPRPEPDEDDE